ncbi:tRNA preQ1(34) S-adenosylmethionine ribosyltransferase-isomerase QueA [Pseudomethylobacillus aquaticus]|uniref:S-adenosylmethionine:tRNA ribosyltransferase-isomerase n=1 Tax=Pseudomethylobacillus aquaticus TaxID=2676064 RepID=A0A3N0V0M4_9PROT|nr:tRNA preQ1(34) S-adenosylmethionine ribosyltransferase-isomerase QueA [Pseudomethylobacillus aquaticus]ROH86255.1 tRNA preQ1(34) S-adenosylmethionine ribosyltransferase-isomerase QueA [Pseudomethylobacillus aquaticus]
MRTEDFDFVLPDALIAQFPAQQRTASRLLRLNGRDGALEDSRFQQLPVHLNAGDLLIFNDTRVIKARLHGQKDSGGAVEVLIERIIDDQRALAHIRASRSPKPGSWLKLSSMLDVEVLERQHDLFMLRFDHSQTVLDLLEQHGNLPLPPYITHDPNADDDTRYQTVYAREPGAVAAPTAGLHFDEAMLQQLRAAGIDIAYVTLHVGAGTFQPVRVDDIAEHKMHSERYRIPQTTVDAIQHAREHGGTITAVGTTALRALESAARGGILCAGEGETDIFITPGYRFQVVERLLTNFHLPKSTLMMLVSAFAGREHVMNAYQHAITQQYRFFSYGDAMLIERGN